MARFEDLPADQKAVLQLVLRQGRTYAEIAGLLKISEAAVQNRALTALDAIGPATAELDDERQDEIGDYLLGQQSASERAATREFLEDSQPGRDWARQVASELRGAGVGGDDLPEIPADPAEVDEAFDALHARREARVQQERSSRLGGVLIIVAVLLVVVLGVLLLTGVIGGDDKDDSTPAAETQSTGTTTGSSTANANTQATVEKQYNLTPPNGGKTPLGVASLVTQSGKRALAVVGQELPASGHYVLWLRNGSKVKFLGFFPPVTGSGTDKGRLQGLVEAPSDLTSYKEMLVTREASSTPKTPSTIILKGSLSG
ncbi:RNA polymerase sigma factor [Baekduia sp. Peel2402]|uniref:RNA polymerase sigma factor n=1 Tax=Baekduia sp. Peel2402 TaxID=3458296 RepID=UPI00403ED54C